MLKFIREIQLKRCFKQLESLGWRKDEKEDTWRIEVNCRHPYTHCVDISKREISGKEPFISIHSYSEECIIEEVDGEKLFYNPAVLLSSEESKIFTKISDIREKEVSK